MDVAEKWPECVTQIITRYTLNDTLDLDKMALFYNMQLKRTDIRCSIMPRWERV